MFITKKEDLKNEIKYLKETNSNLIRYNEKLNEEIKELKNEIKRITISNLKINDIIIFSPIEYGIGIQNTNYQNIQNTNYNNLYSFKKNEIKEGKITAIHQDRCLIKINDTLYSYDEIRIIKLINNEEVNFIY